MKLHMCYLVLLLHLQASPTCAISNFAGTTAINNALFGLELTSGIYSDDSRIRRNDDRACEDRCRKRCKGRRAKDPSNCRRCIPCALGLKPDSLHVTCIRDNEAEENEETRRGNCPEGKVLDPREGPQIPGADAKDLKCAIDDEKDCKPPKLPETRPDGKENDTSFKPKCLNVKENDNTKCDEKQQFQEITVGPDGKAKKTCKPTRQYKNKKRGRLQKLKPKFKQRWESQKEKRAKKEEERRARKNKIDEGRRQKEKEANDKKKKKIKSYRCGMATAMVAGQQIAGLISKRDLTRRAKNEEVESFMDMTACYFDAEFVESDEFLDYWPSDVDVDEIGIGVDEKAYMESFMDRLERADFDFWNSHDFCSPCTKERREEKIAEEEARQQGRRRSLERLLKRDFSTSGVEKRDGALDGNDFCDMDIATKRDVTDVETVKKRNPIAIFVEIALFAGRMAGSLLSRVIPKLSSFSPRLASLLEKTPRNLFKLAPKGQAGNAGSRAAMKQAFRKLADHAAFKKCIRDGRP